jgi:hypothetical protein
MAHFKYCVVPTMGLDDLYIWWVIDHDLSVVNHK